MMDLGTTEWDGMHKHTHTVFMLSAVLTIPGNIGNLKYWVRISVITIANLVRDSLG